MKFKVGDRVRVIYKGAYILRNDQSKGTVIDISNSPVYLVKIDEYMELRFYETQLEHLYDPLGVTQVFNKLQQEVKQDLTDV